MEMINALPVESCVDANREVFDDDANLCEEVCAGWKLVLERIVSVVSCGFD